MTKNGLTIERHAEIGSALKNILQLLAELQCELSVAYPFAGKKGRPFHYIDGAKGKVNSARCYLEYNLYADFPEDATPDIYY